jgi:hypothetical protein
VNREMASAILPVITAYVNGQDIQCRQGDGGEWIDIDKVGFTPKYQYRIKPDQHDFGWATKQLKDGAFVRRAIWADECYVQSEGYLVYSHKRTTLSLDMADFLATDWELSSHKRPESPGELRQVFGLAREPYGVAPRCDKKPKKGRSSV